MNRRRMPLRALAAAILIGACLGLMPQLALALDLSCAVASGATENAVLHAQDESDGTYLFLPRQADVEDLGLSSVRVRSRFGLMPPVHTLMPRRVSTSSTSALPTRMVLFRSLAQRSG